MTRYLYRDDNFRLLRMKSEGYEKTVDGNETTYEKQSGTIRQNFSYQYDLSGNIISIKDTTTDSGYGMTPDELTRKFTYDPLYRLLSPTGRETAATESLPWEDVYRPQDRSAARIQTTVYLRQTWQYSGTATHCCKWKFHQSVSYIDGKDQLENITVGSDEYDFDHDVNGNIISEGDTARHLEYDYADRLKVFSVQTGTSEPSKYAIYLYDAGGQRVKKLVRKQGGDYTSTSYIDGAFEYTYDSDLDEEQNILHIMDGNSRIATIRVGDDFGDTTPEIKYNLEDHLGSSNIQLDRDDLALVSWEECYPFGESSFGGYAKKRYSFCGKEKDEESGLYYYGMRYYSAWTCRFVSVDPLAAKYAFYTPYQYAGNHPINFIDLDGAEPAIPNLNSTSSSDKASHTDQSSSTTSQPVEENNSNSSVESTSQEGSFDQWINEAPLQNTNTDNIVYSSPQAIGTATRDNTSTDVNHFEHIQNDVPWVTNVYNFFQNAEYNSPDDWSALGYSENLGSQDPNELYFPVNSDPKYDDRLTHMNDVFIANNNVTPQNFYDVLIGGWVTGAGPENYLFLPGSKISQSFIGSEILLGAYLEFANMNAGRGTDPNNLLTWSGHVDLDEMRLPAVGRRGDDLYGTVASPEHLVGGAFVTISPLSDGNLSVFIFNTTTVGSGGLNNKSYTRELSPLPQPYANFSQSIYLTIPNRIPFVK